MQNQIEIRQQDMGCGCIAVLKTSLEWLKEDLKQSVINLKQTEEIYAYGGETPDMLFWKEFIDRHVKVRKLEIKKFNLLREARKDQPLHRNTIKACKLCNTLIKQYYTEALELCCDAVANGHITEMWYITKASHFKEHIEKNELDDFQIYK